MQYKLSELVAKFGGVLVGEDLIVSGIAPISIAGPNQISFLSEKKYKKKLSSCQAGAIIISKEDALDDSVENVRMSKIITDNQSLYFCFVSQLFNAPSRLPHGIKSSSVRGSNVIIGGAASISDFVSLGDNVVIGDNCQIYPNVTIGNNVVIGDNVLIYANVSIYANVRIGDNCIFHSGAVIGSDGFGYAPDNKEKWHKRWHKIPQIGGVVIGNDVEIGANTAVDCGTFTPTIIEDGVVIDNLVQIAHNVKIGTNTAIAGCVGIAGSAVIGARCQIAGAAGVHGHIHVADNTVIGGSSGVTKSISEPGFYSGLFPLMSHKEWAKNAVHLKRLNEMYKAIKALEKQVAEKVD